MTEDEMVGWYHQLSGHEFEQAPGVGDGQGSLACCSPWGRTESNMTEQLNWTVQESTDFFIFILVTATLLNLFVSLSMLSYVCSCRILCHLQIEIVFLSSIMSVICFCCLVSLARTSSTILNRRGKNEYPCLIPDFREKSFCSLRMMFTLRFL